MVIVFCQINMQISIWYVKNIPTIIVDIMAITGGVLEKGKKKFRKKKEKAEQDEALEEANKANIDGRGGK